jgi:hypothetical protein
LKLLHGPPHGCARFTTGVQLIVQLDVAMTPTTNNHVTQASLAEFEVVHKPTPWTSQLEFDDI